MSRLKETTPLKTIGSTEYVDIGGFQHIPAKIDTGADSSSIWASHIEVDQEGVLSFQLFDEASPFYTGHTIKRKEFKVAIIRSSSGHEQIRYRVYLSLKIAGHKIKALFNLSDRSRNHYPVLIGRRTISGKFLVDVSKSQTNKPSTNPKTRPIQKRLQEDPYRFHLEHFGSVKNNNNKRKGA